MHKKKNSGGISFPPTTGIYKIFVLHIYLFMLYHARINFFYAFQVILLANLEQPELWSLDSFGKWCLDNENLCGEKSKIIKYMKKGTLKIYSLIKIYEPFI